MLMVTESPLAKTITTVDVGRAFVTFASTRPVMVRLLHKATENETMMNSRHLRTAILWALLLLASAPAAHPMVQVDVVNYERVVRLADVRKLAAERIVESAHAHELLEEEYGYDERDDLEGSSHPIAIVMKFRQRAKEIKEQIDDAARTYRIIRLRELLVVDEMRRNRNPKHGLWVSQHEPENYDGLDERIERELGARYEGAGSEERTRLRAEATGRIRIAHFDRGVQVSITQAQALEVGAARSAARTPTAARMMELAEEIAKFEPDYYPVRTIENDELREHVIGTRRDVALEQYRHLAVAAPFLDTRTGKFATGEARTLIAGNALRNLVEYLKSRPKPNRYFMDFLVRDFERPGLAASLESEIDSWKEYQLATYLHAGLEPSVEEYFLAAARVMRSEEERVDDWFRNNYLGGDDAWTFGLGKLLRVNDGLFTGEAGRPEVEARIIKLKAETDAAATVLEKAAETPANELPRPYRRLLQSMGYIVEDSDGKLHYAIPRGARGLSEAVADVRTRVDLPGAAWLDVVSLKSIGLAVLTTLVPELAVIEAEAFAVWGGLSARSVMAVEVMVDLGVSLAVDGGIAEVERRLSTDKNKDPIQWDKMVLETVVTGAALHGWGLRSEELTDRALREVEESVSETRFFKSLTGEGQEAFYAGCNVFIKNTLSLSGETAITTVFQSYVNDGQITWEAIYATVVQSAMSRIMAAKFREAVSAGADGDSQPPSTTRWYEVSMPTLRDFVQKHCPDVLRKHLEGDENTALAQEFYDAVKAKVELIQNTARREEEARLRSEDVQAYRIMWARDRGDLTQEEFVAAYVADPVGMGPLALRVSELTRERMESDVPAAQRAARQQLDTMFRWRRNEINRTRSADTEKQQVELERLYEYELSLLAEDPIIPGSAGKTSDHDRSSRSIYLRRQLKRIDALRRGALSDGEPILPQIVAHDASEYSDVMAHIIGDRKFVAPADGLLADFEDAPFGWTHSDVKLSLSLASVLKKCSIDQSQTLLDNRLAGRLATEIDPNASPAERQIAERRITAEEYELGQFALRSIEESHRDLAAIRKQVAAERGQPEEHRDVGLEAREHLYDRRFVRINYLWFKLTELERVGKEESQEAVKMRAELHRYLTVAMRDGIETYSQPAGIDVIVNIVQKKVTGPDGVERRVPFSEILNGTEFTLTNHPELERYRPVDIECMLHDQYMFILEHANHFLSGHELPYPTGRALGKYVMRVFLAKKLLGLDIVALRDKGNGDPLARLLNWSETLLKNKDNPTELLAALESFSTESPPSERDGLLAYLRTLQQAVGDMEHMFFPPEAGADNGAYRKMHQGSQAYDSARLEKLADLREKLKFLDDLFGSEVVEVSLLVERDEVERELGQLAGQIARMEELGKKYLGTDWERAAELEERLEGVIFHFNNLPYQIERNSKLAAGYVEERRELQAALDSCLERFNAAGDVDEQKLYDEVSEYAWAKDRTTYLEDRLAYLAQRLLDAREKASRERALAEVDLSGDWRLVVEGMFGEEADVGRVRIAHDGAAISIESVWASEGVPAFSAEGRYVRGRIETIWAPHDDNGEPVDVGKGMRGHLDAAYELADERIHIAPTSQPGHYDEAAGPDWLGLQLARAPADEEFRTHAYDNDEGQKILEYRMRRSAKAGFWWYVGGFGVKDGPWSQWNQDGDVIAEGTYHDGLRNGAWQTFDIDRGWDVDWEGEELRGNYVKGVREGPWVSRSSDGSVVVDLNMRLGIPHGPYVQSGGDEPDRGQFVDGVLEGLVEHNPEDGEPLWSRTMRRGYAHGPTFKTSDDGVRSSGSMAYGLPDGRWSEGRVGEPPLRIIDYRLGLRDGEFVEWWGPDRKKVEGRYAKGLRVGSWRYYDEDDTLTQSEEWALPPEDKGFGLISGEHVYRRMAEIVVTLDELDDFASPAVPEFPNFPGTISVVPSFGELDNLNDFVVVGFSKYYPHTNALAYAHRVTYRDVSVQRLALASRGYADVRGDVDVRTSWRRDGTSERSIVFTDGVFSGASVTYDGSDTPRVSTDYDRGQLSWSRWREDGTNESTATFRAGKLGSYTTRRSNDTRALRVVFPSDYPPRWEELDEEGRAVLRFHQRPNQEVFREVFDREGTRYTLSVKSHEEHSGELREWTIHKGEETGAPFHIQTLDEVGYAGTRTTYDNEGRVLETAEYLLGDRHGETTLYEYSAGVLSSKTVKRYERGEEVDSEDGGD